jgi:hypothetical protein
MLDVTTPQFETRISYIHYMVDYFVFSNFRLFYVAEPSSETQYHVVLSFTLAGLPCFVSALGNTARGAQDPDAVLATLKFAMMDAHYVWVNYDFNNRIDMSAAKDTVDYVPVVELPDLREVYHDGVNYVHELVLNHGWIGNNFR